MFPNKRIVLSVLHEIESVKALKKGEKGINIALEYDIGTSPVSEIKNSSDSTLNFALILGKEESVKRKTMKKSNFDDVDKATGPIKDHPFFSRHCHSHLA